MITDNAFGTLYVGMTSDIARRMYEHREGLYKGFSEKYGLKLLVYCEEYPTAMEAIEREKKLKKWKRYWKIDLIKASNPDWKDLYDTLNN